MRYAVRILPTMTQADPLARRRHHEPAERPLMAWIRTALSLNSFGLDLDFDCVVAASNARGPDGSSHVQPGVQPISIAAATAVLISLIGWAGLVRLLGALLP